MSHALSTVTHCLDCLDPKFSGPFGELHTFEGYLANPRRGSQVAQVSSIHLDYSRIRGLYCPVSSFDFVDLAVESHQNRQISFKNRFLLIVIAAD